MTCEVFFLKYFQNLIDRISITWNCVVDDDTDDDDDDGDDVFHIYRFTC